MDFRHIARRFAASEQRLRRAALGLLAPEYRSVCRQLSDLARGLCTRCRRDFPAVEYPCPRCALPGTGGHVCGRCQMRGPAFDATIAAFGYAEPVSNLIARLKYHGDLSAARLLGQLLADHIAARASTNLPELIVPVPLHPRRIMRRGFNQSIEIGRVVAKQLNIPMATSIARRIRHTPAQQTLSLDRRRHNVLDSFELQHAPEVRHIALVDDVMTSGATLDALAHCFKQHDDYEVHCWVCARA